MVIDRKTFFTLKVSKNIAKIENEKERMEALSQVKDGSRGLVEKTVEAIRSVRAS
jgi:hypothetical protein